jgi:hypothetical protein
MLRRLTGSICIWLALYLVAFNWFFSEIKPIRYFNITSYIPLDQNPLLAKLKDYLEGHGQTPDILMLGSSLYLYPSMRLDERFTNQKTRYDNWFLRNKLSALTEPKAFEDKLIKANSPLKRVHSLAVQGSIASDQLTIWRNVIHHGRLPKLLMLELSPRYLCNNSIDPDKSAVRQALPDWDAVSASLKAKKLADIVSQIAGQYFYYYKVKTDYRELIVALTATVLQHPLNRWEAENHITRPPLSSYTNLDNAFKPEYESKASKFHDLEEYKRVYQPYDKTKFAAQVKAFDELLDLAIAKQIPVLITAMPVSGPNRGLIEKQFLDDYKDYLIKLSSSKYADRKVQLLNLFDSSTFTDSDFEDSAHLNANGADKFFDATTQSLSQLSDSHI